MVRAFSLAALLACAGTCLGQTPFFSEMVINPPDTGGDNGWETIEIMGTPGMSLDGYYIIVIEGDNATPGTSTIAGTVDQVISLNGLSLGSNGLLLMRDSATNVIGTGPDAATTLFIYNPTPDIENGANTFILGFGTPPALNTDLDLNNDGTLDAPLTGFTTVDALSYVNGDEPGLEYADDVGFPANVLGDLGTWTPDYVYRPLTADGRPAGLAVTDLFGTGPAGYTLDPVENQGFTECGIDIFTFIPDIGRRNVECQAGGCAVDLNGDGIADFNDYLEFLNLYNAQDPRVDYNADGIVDFNDYLEFLNQYNIGC